MLLGKGVRRRTRREEDGLGRRAGKGKRTGRRMCKAMKCSKGRAEVSGSSKRGGLRGILEFVVKAMLKVVQTKI